MGARMCAAQKLSYMHTRRSFLKDTAAMSAGILGAGSLSSFIPSFRPVIGLQLYTVRKEMEKDPARTLTNVAQIGYNSLEGATYTGTETFYGMDAKTFGGLLKK